MPFRFLLQPEALKTLRELEFEDDKRDTVKLKKVRICLARSETDPKHPGLQSHTYNDKKGKNGEGVWESYVENNNPSASPMFWHFGPEKHEVTILLITAHPTMKGKK